jgi:3-oxoadipate enol-lactonase
MAATTSLQRRADPGGIEYILDTEIGPLAVEQRGVVSNGRPWLVLWPSVFSDRHLYDRLIPFLEKDHSLVRFDPPGHGRSGMSAKPLTLAATAHASLQALDYLGIDQVYWVGTSWGGMIGIHAALQAPRRIRHLSCVNTPFDLRPKLDLGTRLVVAASRWIGKTGLFASGVARSFFRPETLAADPYFAERHRKVFLNGDQARLHKAARHVLIGRENLTPLLPSLEIPALVLAGRQDTYSVSGMREAAAHIRDGTFQIIENSRHISVADAPNAVNAALREAWAVLPRPTSEDIHA